MDLLIIFGAKYLYFLSLFITLLFFLILDREDKKRFITFGIVTFSIAFLLSVTARELVENPRPFVVGEFEPLIAHEPDNGFPSDHTLLVASLAVVVSFFHRKYGALLWLLSLLVGISRVSAGVHHYADILGSIVISIIAALIAYATIAAWKTHKNPTSF